MRQNLRRSDLFPALGLELLFQRNGARVEGVFVAEALGDERLTRPRQIEHVLAGGLVEARLDAQFAFTVSVEPDHVWSLYRSVRARCNKAVTNGFRESAAMHAQSDQPEEKSDAVQRLVQYRSGNRRAQERRRDDEKGREEHPSSRPDAHVQPHRTGVARDRSPYPAQHRNNRTDINHGCTLLEISLVQGRNPLIRPVIGRWPTEICLLDLFYPCFRPRANSSTQGADRRMSRSREVTMALVAVAFHALLDFLTYWFVRIIKGDQE